jgi:hypothetical protein
VAECDEWVPVSVRTTTSDELRGSPISLAIAYQRLLRAQRPEAEPDHSPSSAEVSDVWNFVVHLLYACVVWLGTLAFNLLISVSGAGCGIAWHAAG